MPLHASGQDNQFSVAPPVSADASDSLPNLSAEHYCQPLTLLNGSDNSAAANLAGNPPFFL